MTSVRRSLRLIRAALVAGLFAAPVLGQDVVTVGTVNTNGPTVTVPVYVRDVSGTTLGMDQPAPSRIQSLSIKVDYAPAAAVSSVTFTRAGITSSLTPTFETSPSGSGTRSLLVTFPQSSNPVPFTLDRAAPGDQVARLTFTLSASANPGSSITLTLDGSLTQLTDEGGTASTKETSGNGRLTLVSGRININPLSVTLSPSSLSVPRGSTGKLTVKTNATVNTATTVSLASGNTSVATVPASVVVGAGKSSATVNVTGTGNGKTSVTATLGESTATSSVTVTEPADPCEAPASPEPEAPTVANSGVAYDVSWSAVGRATEYLVEEADNESFAGAASSVVTTTSKTLVHVVAADSRYWVRVTARNRASGCDTSSPASAAVSVLVLAPEVPPPSLRVLPVVSSTPGQFGSYFRTAVQLYNPTDGAIAGRIVYHPAGKAGSESDPSYAFSLQPRKTLTIDDLLPAIGMSGAGTAEVIAETGSALPVTSYRIFNDAGEAGTSGLAGAALRPEEALRAGDVGSVIAPANLALFRLNIGIRTLDQPASIAITVRDREGSVVRTATRSYPAVYFEQTSSAAILDGLELTGGESISFEVTGGTLFIYGATTDNRTNDPSMQLTARE